MFEIAGGIVLAVLMLTTMYVGLGAFWAVISEMNNRAQLRKYR